MEDVQVFMPVTEPSPKSSPRRETITNHKHSPKSSPREEDPVNSHVNIPPPAAFAENKTKTSSPPPASSSRVSQTRDKIAEQSNKQVVIETMDSPRNNSKVQKEQRKAPVTQEKAPAASSPASSVKTSQHKSPAPPATDSQKKSQKKTAPRPPGDSKTTPKPTPGENKKPELTVSKQVSEQEPARRQEPTQRQPETGSNGMATRKDSLEFSDGFITPDRGAAHLPHGTLSDLKKQRAQRLQERLHDSLRFKEGDKAQADINNFNQQHYHGDDPSINVEPASQVAQYSTGQNGDVRQPNSRSNNNNSYYVQAGNGDTIKKYKFSDTTSVVGDIDKETSCCVVQ